MRAAVVGAELLSRGVQLTVLGSNLDEQALLGSGVPCIDLPLDHPLADGVAAPEADVTAGGALHWAPLRHDGLRRRMALIAAWLERERPAVMVVDVSSEVALLARLMGIPVVLVAQPGDRRDEAHSVALRCASAVLAPWPAWATSAVWRTSVSPDELQVVAVGGVAREPADRDPAPRARDGAHTRSPATAGPYGLVLAGGEGFDDPQIPRVIQTAVPDLDWVVLDGRAWVADVRPLIADSAVVVAHAGQNAVADLARHERPVVLVPQRRPFAEQEHLARALGQEGLAVLATPTALRERGWAGLVDQARAGGGARWRRWECAGAPSRAADLIVRVADG